MEYPRSEILNKSETCRGYKSLKKKINIMSTKKEIRNFIAEHSADLKKETMRYHSCIRDIYLTDKDYVKVEIWENFFKRIIIRMHVANRQYSICYAEGLIDDLDGVWRRFRNAFKKSIAEEEEYGDDKAFAARLKEVYSLF